MAVIRPSGTATVSAMILIISVPQSSGNRPKSPTLPVPVVEKRGFQVVPKKISTGLTMPKKRMVSDSIDRTMPTVVRMAITEQITISARTASSTWLRARRVGEMRRSVHTAPATAQAAITEADRRSHQHPDVSGPGAPELTPAELKRRVWVTRRHVHVDRIASAWLIRRFIDPEASFKFVEGKGYVPEPDELRFDMADAEFTHEGDRCSFETLVFLTGLETDPALRALGEIVHDLDIADARFERPETPGVSALIAGICAGTDDDEERIARGSTALDGFYAHFTRRKED